MATMVIANQKSSAFLGQMDVREFEMKKAAVRALPHKADILCKLKDRRKRGIDFDGTFLKFHEGLYEMGNGEEQWKTNCLINKWSPMNPIQLSGFSLLKNTRNRSIITLENYYEESGQPRIVISWIDGSLTAWLKAGGYKKAFETSMEVRGSLPTKNFRRIIIDTCRGLEYLFSEHLYPSAIKKEDLFLCKEKEKGKGYLLKMLVCQADRLSDVADQDVRKAKLWGDVKSIFQEISKHADEKLTAAAKSFIDYIATGNVDKLDGYPDTWSYKKKTCYLFSLVSADRSTIFPLMSGKQFAWPSLNPLLKDLLSHGGTYATNDAYDYLRLCRNVIKHWRKFSNNVAMLRKLCPTVNAFIQKIEEWSPEFWCNLYRVVGWPGERTTVADRFSTIT